MRLLAVLSATTLWLAPLVAPTPRAQEEEILVPGKRMVRAVQFPYDLKMKLTLFPTGRLEGIAGKAEVQRRKRDIQVKVELEKAPPASQLGAQYRGYVVWALVPGGEFVKLGALERKGKLQTTTTRPAFGIVVSAEADLNATSLTVPVLESGYPRGKRRIYPMKRVYYTPAPTSQQAEP